MTVPATVEQPREAAWTIVLANIGIVYKVVNRYCRRVEDKPDLEQEGTLGLFEAARRFDKAKNVTFATFAWEYVKGYVFRYYREKRNTPTADQITPAIEEQLLEDGEQTYIKSVLGTQLRANLRKLPEGDRMLIMMQWLVPDAFTVRDMAKRLGVAPATVTNMGHAAFEKLRRLMEEERERTP
jgi:RNA polymerase sigma factor (sigma-70 family)